MRSHPALNDGQAAADDPKREAFKFVAPGGRTDDWLRIEERVSSDVLRFGADNCLRQSTLNESDDGQLFELVREGIVPRPTTPEPASKPAAGAP